MQNKKLISEEKKRKIDMINDLLSDKNRYKDLDIWSRLRVFKARIIWSLIKNTKYAK